ncbi:MAG: alpha/beta fold hydrolase [Chloroflexota bacterium]
MAAGTSPVGAAAPAGPTELTGFSVRPFGMGFVTVAYLATDADGNIYLPGGTEGAAIVKLAPDGTLAARYAGTEVVPGQPDTIAGLAIDPATGDLWASDLTADRILHLTPDLEPIGSFGATGAESGAFFGPGGLAVDADGNLVVADTGNDRLQRFAPDGTLLGTLDAPGGTTNPVDVTVAPDGDLLASTTQPMWAGLVVRMHPDGSAATPILPAGQTTELFPNAAVEADGSVLVGDAWNGIIRFGPDGTQQGGPIAVPGMGTAPYAVRVAPDGTLVTLACMFESTDCTLARLDPTGKVLAQWHIAEKPTLLGQTYPVNGADLYLQCAGEGSPTIVWNSGSGGSSWVGTQAYLLGRLARTTRVCIWDRRGVGLSSPTGETDMHDWFGDLADLHGLLAAAGETGPTVMAGYSYGGLLARLYAETYPDGVQGVLAIDPSHEDEYAGPPDPAADAGTMPCDTEACPYFGDIARAHELSGGRVAGVLGDLPLVVLSHDADVPFFGTPEYDAYWLQLGKDTATASSNAVHVSSSWSSHQIPYAHPALVIEALEELVASARAGGAALPPCEAAFPALGGVCEEPVAAG